MGRSYNQNTNRKHCEALYSHRYTRVNGERGLDYFRCVYCGEPADTKEHYPPLNRVPDYESMGLSRETYIIYPSCCECNSLAADELDKSLIDRVERVKDKIARKSHKLLKDNTEWDLEEIQEMGPNMRSHILMGREQAKRAIDRIEYYAGLDAIIEWLNI